MKTREKEVKDQPWIKRLLSERWGAGGQVVVHGEIFDAETLPAIIAGEEEGLATYQIRTADEGKVAEVITLDALSSGHGVGTALIEGLLFETAFRRREASASNNDE